MKEGIEMKSNLTVKIIVALVLGAIVGISLHMISPDAFDGVNKYLFVPLGQIFLKLIQMLVVPIVLFSIILGVAGLGDPKKIGIIGTKTISFFLITTALAITIGVTLASIIQPGKLMDVDASSSPGFEAEKTPGFVETLLNIIPSNPIAAMSSGEMLQIIFFAVFIGVGLAVLGEKTAGMLKIVEQGNELMMYLVNIVMKFAPYGTFGLIATASGSQGWEAIRSMGLYMSVVLIALALHFFIVYGAAVAFLGKYNPLMFFKKFFPAATVAFSLSSSNAVLPLSMKTAQNELKVPKAISGFVQPLGATINMDGTAIMQGVATVFIAQVYDVNLTFSQLVMVVLTAVLASIGTAGVPGVGLIMLAMVLESVGLPVAGIGLIIGVDRLLDMVRTAVNITGDAACAMYITKSEEQKGRLHLDESLDMKN